MKNDMVSTNLVDSLFDFDNSASQEIFDYLSEHLYIQSHMALPRLQRAADLEDGNNFYRSCHKLYYAADDQSRHEAMDEIREQLA
ncbi:hypothetical protein JXA02_01315 [candidate division KSB1 bacterium]|nr:hypothetical protein [candidate division KSB1 bacterium]RQW11020.1 MAG: hypothetical protein EH222_01425 [candidate division KSB1 bacterium]